MGSQDSALDRLRQLGRVFRSQEAGQAGVSWRDLYALRDTGRLLELSRGLFQVAQFSGSDSSDFVAVCARAPRGMVCCESALAYWQLSDEIPSVVHIAVPTGTHRPRIDYPPTKVHVFQSETFGLGRLSVEVEQNDRFWITDRERSVVDAFRLRHLMGEDLAHGALRRYVESGTAKPGRVVELARALRVVTPVMTALRILQA